MTSKKSQIIDLGFRIRVLEDENTEFRRDIDENERSIEQLNHELDALLGGGETEHDTIDAIEIVDEPAASPRKTTTVEARAQSKHATSLQLLERGPILVTFDPRLDGVDVPENLRDRPQQSLRFGVGLKPEIYDLDVNEVGITGTLMFSGRPHSCAISWTAVFAITDEARFGVIWPEDVPAECRTETPAPAAPPKQRHLKSVPRCVLCDDDQRGERVVGPGGSTWRQCPNCGSGAAPEPEPSDELLAEYVVHYDRHPDDEPTPPEPRAA